MQLAIVQNPHTERPQDLVDALRVDEVPSGDMSQLRTLFGGSERIKIAGQ
jgi:hypothetical protein